MLQTPFVSLMKHWREERLLCHQHCVDNYSSETADWDIMTDGFPVTSCCMIVCEGTAERGELNHPTSSRLSELCFTCLPYNALMMEDLFWTLVPDNSSSESDCESDGEGSTCSSSSDSEVFDVIAEIKRKKAHPDRLHEELWYNDLGQVGLS